MQSTIRRYQIQDKEQLLQILRLNTPEYFDISEEAEYALYLENHREDYFVIEFGGQIAGAGGYNHVNDVVRISWDLIHPTYHGKGLGTQLLNYRIEAIKKAAKVEVIMVRTSQLANDFYARFGFELVQVEKDYWAPGFDLYQMELLIQE